METIEVLDLSLIMSGLAKAFSDVAFLSGHNHKYFDYNAASSKQALIEFLNHAKDLKALRLKLAKGFKEGPEDFIQFGGLAGGGRIFTAQ